MVHVAGPPPCQSRMTARPLPPPISPRPALRSAEVRETGGRPRSSVAPVSGGSWARPAPSALAFLPLADSESMLSRSVSEQILGIQHQPRTANSSRPPSIRGFGEIMSRPSWTPKPWLARDPRRYSASTILLFYSFSTRTSGPTGPMGARELALDLRRVHDVSGSGRDWGLAALALAGRPSRPNDRMALRKLARPGLVGQLMRPVAPAAARGISPPTRSRPIPSSSRTSADTVSCDSGRILAVGSR